MIETRKKMERGHGYATSQWLRCRLCPWTYLFFPEADTWDGAWSAVARHAQEAHPEHVRSVEP